MADQDVNPLTDVERAELEALRAEKARRERAELEALRAEQAAADAADVLCQESSHSAVSASATTPLTSAQTRIPTGVSATKPMPEDRTFAQRMVLSEGEDEDGMPTMPPAQKIIIAICFVGVIAFVTYTVLSNMGMI